jgi:hypothetical protein
MNLKAKKIALLIAGLSVSAVTAAAPVTVSEIESARSGGTLQQAWITGASAPTKSIYEGWVAGCDADTNAIFSNHASSSSTATPGSIGNYNAYACKRSTKVSVLYQTVDGGSLNAYTPHTIGAVLARVKFVGTGNGCSGTTRSYVDAVNSANNATVYKGCTLVGANLPTSGSVAAQSATNAAALAVDSNGPQYPVGGYSDVEAAFFAPSIGGGSVASKGTEEDVGVGQAFGVAVSVPLYRAMQVQQGITETGSTSADFDPAKAPNISSAQYTSLVAIGGDNKIGLLLPSSTSRINIERRVDTSGTQASSNAFFLKNPCAAGVAATLEPTVASNNVVGEYQVTLNSGSGDVKTRLNSASNSAVDNDKYAIGVLSTENNWRTESSTPGYRYLKVDGVHPETGDTDRARLTSVSGDYKFHMEMKSFIRADGINGKVDKSAFEAAVIPAITAQLKLPAAAACATFPRGLTLNPANGSECTVGTQVAKMTNGGKNCAAQIEFIQ